MRARALGLLAACLATAPLYANPFTPGLDAQRRAAQTLMPARIELPAPSTHPKATSTVRIRFYADEDYRAGLFRWADRTKGQLESLNQIIEPTFGVRFEAESFRRWHRQGGNTDVFQVLGELEKMDVGAGVDLVVGFVSPLPLVATSMHEIGAARLLGRHLVLRGMASADEANALKGLDLLDTAEREQIYSHRKYHKEVAVFLHEWLHTLGAIHNSNPTSLMHPSYSNTMSTLAIVDAELAAAALHDRMAERQTGTVDWANLRAALEHSASPEWFTKERDDLMATLVAQAPRGAPLDRARDSHRTEAELSREDMEQFNQALALARTDKAREAWALARRLGERYPKSVEVQRMVCRLSFVKAAGDEGVRACGRANDLAPASPEPLVDAAQARILRKEFPEALATVDQAAALAERKPEQVDVWTWIAQLYAQLGLFSRADQALARAGEKAAHGREARAAVAHHRGAFGVPSGALPPEREQEYADHFRRVLGFIDAGKLREARAAADTGRKAFPGVPGLEVLACEIEARQSHLRPAAKACTHALSVMPEMPRAHYLIGHIKLNTGEREGAEAAFRQSIALDPKETSPWQALADLYRVSGQRQALSTLKREYEKAFAKPLER